MNGIIKCAIIPKKNGVMEIPRTENANNLSTQETFEAYYNKHKSNWMNNLKQVAQDAKDTIMGQTVKLEVEVKKDTTLSSYLSGLAVLDGMDAEKTAGMSYTEAKIGSIFEGNKITTSQGTTNVAKNLNQSNIEYFENLFTNMNTVYIHLQNLLFIVVGGFFLATLGGGKIQKYLENRGQSTGNKEPYLHKFFIPLLCAGVFYMPITSGGGVNSTMIQKIIQYLTAEANHIADVASSIGSSVYIDKMIESVAAQDFVDNSGDKSGHLLRDLDEIQATFIKEKVAEQLPKCIARYSTDNLQDFQFVQAEALKWEEMVAKEELNKGGWFSKLFDGVKSKFDAFFSFKAPDNVEDISLEACAQLTQEYQEAERILAIIEKAKENQDKNKGSWESMRQDQAVQTIATTQEMIVTNEKLYGWLNSLIVPASVLMIEAQGNFKAAMTQSPSNLRDEINEQNRRVAGKSREDSISSDWSNKIAEFVTPYFTTLMLPGADKMRTFFNEVGASKDENGKTQLNGTMRNAIVGTACSYIVYKLFAEDELISLDTPIVGYFCSQTAQTLGEQSAVSKMGSLVITYYLYKDILHYIPIVIVTIAGILAFLSYFVSLCKYYYISPFVVAFALTTKRVDKIVNFLVTGVTIFFKPVLIVLFLYLALFLHYILQDLFIVTSMTQFSVIASPSFDNAIDWTTSFTVGVIKMLVLFFGSLASCYIVWKTIMTGPDWTFKLLGLDKDSDNTIVSSLSNKMETKAVVV